jgi:hypothetical protein
MEKNNLLYDLINEFAHYGTNNSHEILSEKVSFEEIKLMLKIFLRVTHNTHINLCDEYDDHKEYILNIPLFKSFVLDEQILNNKLTFDECAKNILKDIY